MQQCLIDYTHLSDIDQAEMSSQWNSLLSGEGHPNDVIPSQLSMNFYPGEQHDTVIGPQGDFIGFGDVAQFDAKSRHFGTGTAASNFTSVNSAFVHHLSHRFPACTVNKEMLVFLERARTSPMLHLQIDHEIASVHEMNRYLLTPEGRNRYGNYSSCEQLIADFGFAGSFNAMIPGYMANGGRSQLDSAIVVGRRARCAAITRGCVTPGDSVCDRIMSTVYLLCTRRRMGSNDVLRTRDITGASPHQQDGYYYWTFNIYVAPSRAPPPSFLYIDDDSCGTAILVGRIIQNNGQNKQSVETTKRAQESMNGPLNALIKDRDYIETVPLLPYVDIAMNM